MAVRRLLTVPAYLLLALLGLAAAPLWIPALLLVDLVRPGPRAALRCGLFFEHYFLCETAGILASGVIPWLGGGSDARLERYFRLQWWWGSALLGGATRIFGLRFEIEGEEQASRAPMLLFLRHASMADTVLASRYVSQPHGIRLRYVLKRELLWDPCIDIVGNRLPNHFVERDSDDSEAEIRAVSALAADLGPRDGVLIYPEGTRFTALRRERILASLREKGRHALAARAEALRHLLPPRSGGPLALIEASPGVDVVFCAHSGFEGAATFGSLWRGALVGQLVRVRFWRVPAGEIPAGREARSDWLFDQWSRIDTWLEASVDSERSATA